MPKISIYQVFPRLFGNRVTNPVQNGTIQQNGVGKMNDFTPTVLRQIKELGITHIWYTGLIEHASCSENGKERALHHPSIVKGLAGSPYAISDYYDIDMDIAESIPDRMVEFEALIKRTHDQDLKCIIDFVPNHVARQYHSDIYPDRDFGITDDCNLAFSPTNDFYYVPGQQLHLPPDSGTICISNSFSEPYYEFPAKATGNDQFSAFPSINDWYETVKLNYGVDYQGYRQTYFSPQPPLWQKMVDILLYWADKQVDAFRCDMAEMVPVEFWEYAIAKVKAKFPSVEFIAEVYNPSLYSIYVERGGFDYLYDKVGLYDALRSVICHEGPAYQITQCWRYLNGFDAHMLRFMENHDEQRIASPQFAGDPFKAIPAMVISATLNVGPVLIYAGQEVGEPAAGATGYSGDDGRTTIFDYFNIPHLQRWFNSGKADGYLLTEDEKLLRTTYQQILNLSIKEQAISEGKFYDLMWANNQYGGPDYRKIYAYLRYTDSSILLHLLNFDQQNEHGFLFKIPEHAWGEMEVPIDKMINLKPIFGVAPSLSFDAKHLAESGFWITIQPNGSIIYKISH